MKAESKTPAERLPFECQQCSDCCQGQGGIYFEPDDIPSAARLVNLSPEQFIQRYCRAEGGRYAVLAEPGGACLLLGPSGCMVHAAKPEICRRWPFFGNILERESAFEEAKLVCRGLDPDCTHEAFREFYQSMKQKESDNP